MEFHPYAETFPLLDGPDYEAFRNDIAANGVREPIKYRLIPNGNGGNRQGLDGRNRRKACDELEIPCPEVLVHVPDEDVENVIDSLNFHRRHLTLDQQKKKRAERVERVAKLRTQGYSTRDIAEKEAVSKETVRNDLKEATGKGLPVDPPDGKIDSADGKKRPVETSKKTDPILCPRCARDKRVGNVMVKSCADCKALRKTDETKAEPEPELPPSDANGTEWPAKALPAVQETPRLNSFRLGIVALLSQVNGEKDDDKESRQNGLAHSSLRNHIDWTEIARVLKQVRDNCISGTPKYVCPYCEGTGKTKGEKCKPCKGDCWVPAHLYKHAPKDGAK